jgi:hypothetical protein
MMWTAARRPILRTSSSSIVYRRSLATTTTTSQEVEGAGAQKGEGPIGEDGRHEIWREDIYDHDNEPRYGREREENLKREDTTR